MPVRIVKEMLGHQSASQKEGYAITEQISIWGRNEGLKQRLPDKEDISCELTLKTVERMEKQLIEMNKKPGLMA